MKAPSVIKFSLKWGGNTYKGSYRISDDLITVSSDLSHCSARVNGMAPEFAARLLLREMIESGYVIPER